MNINGSFSQKLRIFGALPGPLALFLLAVVCLPVTSARANGAQGKESRPAASQHQTSSAVKELPPRPAVGLHPNPLANELEALECSAEDAFELAIVGKMERLPKKLDTIKRTAAALPVVQDELGSNLLPHLRHTITELEQAVSSKDRLEVMRFANRVSLIAATLAVPLKPCVPTEVSLLDYNARELAIWAEMKRNERLSSIVIRMHLAWQALMPKLVDRNATRELRKFSDLMGHLEAARTPEEYGRLSRQVSSELGTMKLIFARNAK